MKWQVEVEELFTSMVTNNMRMEKLLIKNWKMIIVNWGDR